MRYRWFALGLPMAMLASVVACEFAFPTRLADEALDTGGPPQQEDSGADAPADDAGCVLATLPEKPLVDNLSGGNIVITAAVKSVTFQPLADAGAPTLLGFDLDGVCTSCRGPGSCVAAKTVCDGPGGRDQGGNALLSLYDSLSANTSEGTLSSRIQRGRVGFIIWVAGYNGTPNDSQVYVGMIVSPGIVSGDGGTRIHPKWDGKDEWNVDPDFAHQTQGGENVWAPNDDLVTNEAYVTNGKLVARLPVFYLNFDVARIALHDVLFAADLTPIDIGYQLDGVFSGRITTREILTAAAGVPDPADKTGFTFLCGDSANYQQLRSTLCKSVDLAANARDDRKGARCTAISLAVGFSAVSARTGTAWSPRPTKLGCDGAIDDCTP